MERARQKKMTVTCQITGERLPLDKAFPVDLIRDAVLTTLREKCPDLDMHGYVSKDEVDQARLRYAQELAQQELAEMADLKREVAESLLKHESLVKNLNSEYDANTSIGERIADKVATFGGSWSFIILFGIVLFSWMFINSGLLIARPFDPFPFIFLNLVLSCIAAIQAPVIMMSQNRQEARDRLRGENDYKTNLKAELEIQHINEKMDKLINDQWKHLLEIQQMQMEMIEELAKSRTAS